MVKRAGAQMVQMVKPAGPKIDAIGGGNTAKRAKAVKSAKRHNGKTGRGVNMVKMVKPARPKIDAIGERG